MVPEKLIYWRRYLVGLLLCCAKLVAWAQITSPAYQFSYLAGSPTAVNDVDGVGSAAGFTTPVGLAIDAVGTVYVCDATTGAIRSIASDGTVGTIISWVDHQPGTGFDPVPVGQFSSPHGIAVDAAGNIYVADTNHHTIRKIARTSPNRVVTTIAGMENAPGFVDGDGSAARFNQPYGLALDGQGNLFVADAGNGAIRKLTPNGSVTTVAGGGALIGTNPDGSGRAAHFYYPTALTVDAGGAIYVADSTLIRRIVGETVTTLAGVAGDYGASDGAVAAVRFYNLQGIAVDGSNHVYVVDTGTTGSGPVPPWGGHTVRRCSTVTGETTTIGGAVRQFGSSDGVGAAARFSRPAGLALGSNGTIYIADTGNHAIRKGVPSGGTLLVPQLNWATPAPMLVGTALSTAQLNATVDAPGTLLYSPESGTVIQGTGSIHLAVSFVPTDPLTYTTGEARQTVEVRATTVTEPTVVSQPQDQLVLVGDTAQFTFTADGGANALQVWMVSKDHGATWQNIPAATGATLSIAGVTHEMSGYIYQSFVMNAAGSVASKRVYLTVTSSIAYFGAYFGTTSGGGQWAMWLSSPDDGVFIAHLPARNSVIVQKVTATLAGKITGSGTERTVAVEASSAMVRTTTGAAHALTATAFTLNGQVTVIGQGKRAFNGELTGLGETFTGEFKAGNGMQTPNSGSFYTAVSVNRDSGTLYSVVGYGGDVFAVVVGSTFLDSASGSLAADGAMTVRTTAGGRLMLAVDGGHRQITANLTAAATSHALRFVGLASGVDSTSHLINISARVYCGEGDNVAIGGFVISGSGQKRVLVRAVGPSLEAAGLAADAVLADPEIEVHSGATVVAANDNWNDDPTQGAAITAAANRLGAAALTAVDVKSSAALLSLSAGAYSFVVKGHAGATGIVLLEVYDADEGSGSATFMNISARAFCAAGDRVTIGGFVISGNAPKRVLLRGVGPTLANLGIKASDVLADPGIELHHDQSTVATNDDAGDNDNRASIVSTGGRIGATPIGTGDATSAALLQSLEPGAYSFIASGKAASSGIVLIEIYDAD